MQPQQSFTLNCYIHGSLLRKINKECQNHIVLPTNAASMARQTGTVTVVQALRLHCLSARHQGRRAAVWRPRAKRLRAQPGVLVVSSVDSHQLVASLALRLLPLPLATSMLAWALTNENRACWLSCSPSSSQLLSSGPTPKSGLRGLRASAALGRVVWGERGALRCPRLYP